MAPAILNFGNGWELGIGSTAQPLCCGEEYPGVYWIAHWVRPRASLGFFWKKEKTLTLPRNRTTIPRIRSLWPSHYTDCFLHPLPRSQYLQMWLLMVGRYSALKDIYVYIYIYK